MTKKKVIVFGASGIIGQHLRLHVPDDIEVIYCRKQPDPLHSSSFDLCDIHRRENFLAIHQPDCIVNLAGEAATDKVHFDSQTYYDINVNVPERLARYCHNTGCHYIHISSQGVFSGLHPPYSSNDLGHPVNIYGRQKAEAEARVSVFDNWTILRPTFLLGVRPLPFVGRVNPFEQMIATTLQVQVNDRWFSVAFAISAAKAIWAIMKAIGVRKQSYNIGLPLSFSRCTLAKRIAPDAEIESLTHETLETRLGYALAPRPLNTTYAGSSAIHGGSFESCLAECIDQWQKRLSGSIEDRATEIAIFLGISYQKAFQHLQQGFGSLHADVAKSFKGAYADTEQRRRSWYRTTDAYIWELSAYHLDSGFNYTGKMVGLVERLKAEGARRVLCLGDGIGDLTLHLNAQGLVPVYHDLAGSLTAEFACFRMWRRLGHYLATCLTDGDVPVLEPGYDAIVSLDFFEHLENVEGWVRSCYDALVPGGLLCAQNAFAIGSGIDGSIPCHLAENDRYEHDWDKMLVQIGFVQDINAPNWYRKPI